MTKALVAVLLLFPLTLFCQTGSIRGQVTDARSGEPLVGANVIVVGSKPGHGAATDMNGMFRMNRIPPGVYVVRVTYIDYETITLQNVKVDAGQVAEADVVMRKEGDTQIVVEREGDSTVVRQDSTLKASADSAKQKAGDRKNGQ